MSPKILEAAKQKGIYRRVVCAEVGEEEMPFEDSKKSLFQTWKNGLVKCLEELDEYLGTLIKLLYKLC